MAPVSKSALLNIPYYYYYYYSMSSAEDNPSQSCMDNTL